MKVATTTHVTHNPFGESHWASCLRENLTSSSYGEGLETSRQFADPRQSFTRQLFFKWIKQHLRIKKFYGNSENAVKSQIWTAVSVYVLVAIVKKRLNLDASLYTLLQILSVTLFEKMPLQQAFPDSDYLYCVTKYPYYDELQILSEIRRWPLAVTRWKPVLRSTRIAWLRRSPMPIGAHPSVGT